MAMISADVFVATVFFIEETMFYRPHHFEEIFGVQDRPEPVSNAELGSLEKDIQNESSPDSSNPNTSPDQTSMTRSMNDNVPAQVKAYRENLELWGYRHPSQPNTFKAWCLPFPLYQFSEVVFAGVLVGGILSWYNVVGGSLALILSNEPYNFSVNSVGLTYLACAIGVTIGYILSGWMSDIMTIKIARHNNGVMEPEYRLWMVAVSAVAHPAGCRLYGVGASNSIHWVGIVFGLLLISISFPIGSSLAFTYILDSYKEVAGEGLVSATLIRNVMAKFD